jgi:hypothetical protein
MILLEARGQSLTLKTKQNKTKTKFLETSNNGNITHQNSQNATKTI